MRNLALSAVLAIVLAAPAVAADEEKQEKPKAEIIAYGPDGKPDRVRIDGYEYKLCRGGQTDGCINPQDAGFDWGGKEIDYWPGKPASEIEGPLPEHQPDEQPTDSDKRG